MRWVFVRPRASSPYYDPEMQEPLGIECLAAAREAAGDRILILDATLDGHDEQRIGRRLAAFEPDAVGMSLTTGGEVPSLESIYAAAKQSLGGRRVIWIAGGNFISTEPDRAAELLPADFCLVRFEGERALEAIAQDWRRGHCPVGTVLCGEAVDHLDDLPCALRPYARHVIARGWAFNLQGSRGCCGACRYCASPGMSAITGTRWRGRSPGHVAAEIEAIYRDHGGQAFNFVDEDFLGPVLGAEKRAEEFAEELRRRGLPVVFSIQVRPATLNERIIDMLTSVGLRYVFMGLESDDPEDFFRWGRPWTEDPWRFVRHLRARGAEVNVGTLLFHPHATLEGIRRFARKLHGYGLLEYRSAINRLDAMPGSACFADAQRAGHVPADALGPQHLPFERREVGEFYEDLVVALAPLGPPSMHALCCVPPLLTQIETGRVPVSTRQRLQEIEEILDEAVAGSFFSLLDAYESGSSTDSHVTALRSRNFDVALSGAQQLVAGGFADNFDDLRDAIRLDAGI